MKKDLGLAGVAALSRGGGAFLFILAVGHATAASDFGRFSYAIAVATIVGVVVDFGFQLKTLSEMAARPSDADRIFATALYSKLLLAGAAALLLLTLWHVSPAVVPSTSLILAVAFVAQSFGLFLLVPVRATGAFSLEAVLALVDGTLTVIAAALILYLSTDLLMSSSLFAAAKVATLLVTARATSTRRLTPIGQPYNLVSELSNGWPFAAHLMVGAIYLNADTFVLRDLVSESEFGIYQGGIRLLVGGGVLLSVINSVYVPHYRRELDRLPADVLRSTYLWMLTSVLLGTVGWIVLNAWGAELSTLLFGSDMRSLGELLGLFWLTYCLRIGGAVFGVVLTVTGEQRVRLGLGVLALFAIVGFDFIVVPVSGIRGAAWVLLLVHAALLCAFAFRSRTLLISKISHVAQD